MNDKNAVEKLKEARRKVLKICQIGMIHISEDFYLQLLACEDFESITASRFNDAITLESWVHDLFGYPYIIHHEPCDIEFWFEDENNNKITIDN